AKIKPFIKIETSELTIKTSSVFNFIDKAVAEKPEKAALIFGQERLTYQELNNVSQQLAQYFRQNGVGPGSIVPVCMKRSLEVIITLLEILPAGVTYAPVGLNLTDAILSPHLRELNAHFVVAHRHTSNKIKSTDDNVVLLEWDQQALLDHREATFMPDNSFDTEQLAYIIFTSGSTGNPKGVLVENRQLSHAVE